MPLKLCDNIFNPLTGNLIFNTFLVLFCEGTSHIQKAVPPSARAQISRYHVSKGHFGYLLLMYWIHTRSHKMRRIITPRLNQ